MENEDIKKRLNEYKGDGVEEVQVGQYYERKSGKQVVKVTKVESRWMITVETVMSKGKLITEDDDEYGVRNTNVYVLKEDFNLIPELKSNLIYGGKSKKNLKSTP